LSAAANAIPEKKPKANFIQNFSVRFREENDRIILSWNKPMPDAACSIIEIEMDGSLEEIPVI
jgi:hypothetical protein